MTRFMLDTNTGSFFLRGEPTVVNRIVRAPMVSLCISAITEAELLFGLAKRAAAKKLHIAVQEFLLRVEALPWDSSAARASGEIRAEVERSGKILSPCDMPMAAHALSADFTLVTDDKAFSSVKDLKVENWLG